MRSLWGKVVLGIAFSILFFSQCQRQRPLPARRQQDSGAICFPFFLSQKIMVVNEEQDNELEGHYLKILEVVNDSTYRVNLPPAFYPAITNATWMFGWPTGKAYYDAGNENLREIKHIDTINSLIILGKLLRGSGNPSLNQRVVFWNVNPSGFSNRYAGKVVRPGDWKSFAGSSIEFGAIVFDSLHKYWIMYTQEVDTTSVKIYAATSTDLRSWTAANNGKEIFNPRDFAATNWAGLAEDGKTHQTARMYNAIYHNGTYYFFLSGYGKDGKRAIGLITATDPLKGPFTILPNRS